MFTWRISFTKSRAPYLLSRRRWGTTALPEDDRPDLRAAANSLLPGQISVNNHEQSPDRWNNCGDIAPERLFTWTGI
jgi:hypothetical protein